MTIKDIVELTPIVAAVSIPLHPAIPEYAGCTAHFFAKDGDEGRSIYVGFDMDGQDSQLFEMRYDEWADMICKLQAEVILSNTEDPYMQLLTPGGNQ